MMKFLFQTESSWSCLVLRLALGVVMFPHGAQKVFGWFGGYGFEASLGMFTEKMHIPALLAILVILAESAGSLGLITGLFTRVAAFGILCDMIGAVALVHWRNGLFMNWSGKQAGEGFEYHLLMIGMALALVLAGGGKFSLDRVVAARRK